MVLGMPLATLLALARQYGPRWLRIGGRRRSSISCARCR
jgi:hypothetical protein